MSLRAIRVTLTYHAGGNASSGRAPVRALLDRFMPECFRPTTVSGVWAGRQLTSTPHGTAQWEGIPLWPGETPDGDTITRFAGSAMSPPPILGEADYACTWAGALSHRPPLEGGEPGWYARIKLPADAGRPAQLMTIAEVALEHAGLTPSVAVTFPFGGYPLTSLSTRLGEDGRVQRAPRPMVVEENRRALFGWIGKLPDQLAWRADLEWEVNAGDVLFDEDFEALREWERRLQEGSR